MSRRVWDISVENHPAMHVYPGDPPLEMTQVRSIAAGDPANLTHLSLGAHTGTHVDAPAHFIEGGATLDQVPLDRMVGEATVVDLRGRRTIDGAALRSCTVPEGGILLCKTDNSRLWSESAFQRDFTYFTTDAARVLLERRVRTVGLDYLSIEEFGSRTFEVHKALLGAGVFIIEGLDLSAVDAGTYELVCLPVRFRGVDGAPARAVLLQ